MIKYSFFCQNCNYETDVPTLDCPDCTCVMQRKSKFKPIIFVFCVIAFILGNIIILNEFFHFYNEDLILHFTKVHPKLSYTDNSPINTDNNPVQLVYENNDNWKVYYPSDKGDFELIPKAKYKISGMVVTKDTIPQINGWRRDEFSEDIPLIDIGLVWGDIVYLDYKKYYNFRSGGRFMYYRQKQDSPLSFEYISNHLSHNHLIAANENIMKALYSISLDDIVELTGLLVNVKMPSGRIAASSLSRGDNGGGACEIMYVTKIKSGNKVYE